MGRLVIAISTRDTRLGVDSAGDGIVSPPKVVELVEFVGCAEAADFVKGQFKATPRFALILGTGSNQLADAVSSAAMIDYRQIPHFPHSTALGHRGRLVCGRLANQPIVVMQGRFHLYEGYRRERVSLPIEMLSAGWDRFITSQASAKLREVATATKMVALGTGR